MTMGEWFAAVAGFVVVVGVSLAAMVATALVLIAKMEQPVSGWIAFTASNVLCLLLSVRGRERSAFARGAFWASVADLAVAMGMFVPCTRARPIY